MIIELCPQEKWSRQIKDEADYLGPLSDYRVKESCIEILNSLRTGGGPAHLKTCNMLVIQTLRALLHTEYRDLQPKVSWKVEGQEVDMDNNMRSHKM